MIEIEQNNSEFELIESYEEFAEKGHSFVWCLVGNIVEEHEFGEGHEVKIGTKQFGPGAKVFVAPVQWGDGFENVVTIGVPRQKKTYIEIITRRNYIENFRLQKVFKPIILKRMCSSKYSWWGDSETDREKVVNYLSFLNPKRSYPKDII